MTGRPTVSVLMPAYRSERTIARAVGSVLAQDFPDWELVIASDDGADYVSVLAGAGIADARIRQVATKRHGSGCANARNTALAAAAGELLTPLDTDDLFLPGRLAALVPAARRTGAVVDNVAAVEEESGRVLAHLVPPEETLDALDAARFFRTSVPAKPLAAAALGVAWDPEAGLSDDVLYIARLMDRLGPLSFVARPLQEYRVAEGTLCHRDDSVGVAEAGYRRLLERLDDGSLAIADPGLRAAMRAGIARKRRLNLAYGDARARGFAGTFQHFAAAEAGRLQVSGLE